MEKLTEADVHETEPNIRNKLARGIIHSSVVDLMPRSDWPSYAAIAGFIIIVCLGSYLSPWITGLIPGGVYSVANTQNTSNLEQDTQKTTTQNKKSPSTAEYKDPCTDGEKGDLCAQLRMAAAAELQSQLNFAGVVLLAVTLLFTGWAAVAASQAANAAKDAVEMSTRIEQPVIFLTRIEPVNTEYSVYGISLHFENAGRLPATFDAISFWGRDAALSSKDFFNDLISENHGAVLRKGDTTTIRCSPWNSSATFPLSDEPLIIRGAFRYDSQLGVRKWVYFCFSGAPDKAAQIVGRDVLVWRKHGGPELNYEREEHKKHYIKRR